MRDALKTVAIREVKTPLETDLGVTRYIGDWIRSHGSHPTFVFRNIKGYEGFPVVMNLLKRPVLLDALGLPSEGYLPVLVERLRSPRSEVTRGESLATESCSSLADLPILKHQPREAGKYLTSFVGCLKDPDSGSYNLGFYRALVKTGNRLVVFMDPRTHAYEILESHWQNQAEVPFTMFCGGPLSTYLVAASSIAKDFDSFEASSAIARKPLVLDTNDAAAAPVEAEIVLRGRILHEFDEEAPFGEFKGYYCSPTQSPVFVVDEIRTRPEPYYLGLFCGKESGLTLMSLQNEALLFQRLTELGFVVEDVRYPLEALGEFKTLIKSPQASMALLEAAMELDPRTKIVIVADDIDDIFIKASIFDFTVIKQPLIKRGERRGDRVGMLLHPNEDLEWVEF